MIDKQIVKVKNIAIGGDNPVRIQAMTDTPTENILATVKQINQLFRSGAEIVRITVNNKESAAAVVKIREKLEQMNLNIPIVGDFHYNGDKLLANNSECAQALDKYRINPGNVGRKAKKNDNFSRIIQIACKFNKPVRIGVNWGSLDQDLLQNMLDNNQKRDEPLSLEEITHQTLISSAVESAALAEAIGLAKDKIILSCKVSNPPILIKLYQQLHSLCSYPLHLGLTEAGMGLQGIVSSVSAMAVLLQQGIGNTIRVSLTPEIDGDRTNEVKVAQNILQSLGLRKFQPVVISCPGCGRTSSSYFRELTQSIQEWVEQSMPQWKKQYPGAENITIAVMGCVVNGPGESKKANLGISLPGTGENPVAVVYQDGERLQTLKGDAILPQFKSIISEYLSHYTGP